MNNTNTVNNMQCSKIIPITVKYQIKTITNTKTETSHIKYYLHTIHLYYSLYHTSYKYN